MSREEPVVVTEVPTSASEPVVATEVPNSASEPILASTQNPIEEEKLFKEIPDENLKEEKLDSA